MKGKRVLLTGGTGGLGLGVTPAVLERGASTITIPFHSEKGLERLKSKLSALDFERIRFVKADLNQESVVEQLVNDLGRVDVLIHLVGGFSMGATDQFSFADWQKSLDLNLNTTFLVCKHCLRLMRKHEYGRIVTVGSRGAVQPSAKGAAYCAAKAGVVALTQAIAQETKDLDITANTILPSVIDTPDNREAMGDQQADRWVKPESIAQVICWLASESAKDIRGAAIPIYGAI
ncbi:short-chain dehydrogenase/reductase SDR [Gloeothece citriformis PCC 7424]|uniref:Short-chain dehydrogenase/reductase SDR n=1 Tax=Gloeothece citriformis (strain PCC 7424) TaxID=65393 RepID=B7K811_GLOC7|nr:3-oxoacyl-ACP reductase FabG [Gloeothece citriformis]ACK68499.1 short-chain dehydrogenase/reductase SDR [Gloeothece citriformis PCC 7424]